MAELETIPPEEAKQIDHIVELTREQLKKRYTGQPRFLRGVHPKDHGCVKATFTVLDDLSAEHRVGVFVNPGQKFDAWIRFSNAAPLVSPDSPPNEETGMIGHGSRGMAVKVMGVSGSPLTTTNLTTMQGPLNQDFLMINQPVFAFANVEDYEVLSEIILKDNEKPKRFFKERIRRMPDGRPDTSDPMTRRALRTGSIIGRITSTSMTSDPKANPPVFAAFQRPPLSPLDNEYFGAAPFLFGEGRVMRFKVKPVSPEPGDVTNEMLKEESYLRAALHKRLTAGDCNDIQFLFQVQVRSAESLSGKIDTHIEDVCFDWDDEKHPANQDTEKHPFVTVARIAIPTPQDCSTDEQKEFCESLIFSPWNGLRDHRPLGSINRLRRAVYEASTQERGKERSAAK